MTDGRIPVLYVAPWVDFGGSDKGTIDWFRWLDRSRFAPSLITTQPSLNRRLAELHPYAEEVWALPDLFAGEHFPRFILEFIVSRRIRIVHVMHSRLGYDLLPDIWTLEDPPKVVVQLHVEEQANQTYVRYATTRYGNLVHAFSVSSRHLGAAVRNYGIPSDRIAVIATGVDAEEEFCPERVSPRPGLSAGTVHILFVGRLAEQKDPLLMVEVARELRRRGLAFTLHVLGDGPLEHEVRARVATHGLQEHVLLEPQTRDMASWYAAADLVLMTSSFEGVPYVIYEALAMRVPVVAPALPGNLELMGDAGGALVAPRNDVLAYADALEPLIVDGARRRRIGAQGRRLVRDGHGVREMGDRHAELYERLLGPGGPGAGPQRTSPSDVGAAPISFVTRPGRGTPLVSIVTPCFNGGRWLRELVASVGEQTYPALEMIVVDDGSTEQETLTYLDELSAGGEVRLLRANRNRGPGAARNLGVEQARGRYILPVDADNLLMPGAIERAVAQLQAAGERVGFVYPTLQHFGNREDYYEPPAFNAWLLRQDNFIESSSLIDRDVFDHGLRYVEDDDDIGHEDWDFVLTLAERGIRGEPARGRTLRYRNHGFSRSYLVGATRPGTAENIRRRHLGLDVRLKSRWAPALSVVALAPMQLDSDAWRAVWTAAGRQRLQDFELLCCVDREPPRAAHLPAVRALPRGLQHAPVQALAHALELTAAPHLALTYGTGAELLGDPGSLERLVRVLEDGGTEGVLAFADAFADADADADAEALRYPWSHLGGGTPDLEPHSLALSRRRLEPPVLPDALDEGDPLGDLVRWHQLRRVPIQWRQLGATTPRPARPSGTRGPLRPAPRSRAQAAERRLRSQVETVRPGAGTTVPRWETSPIWAPTFTHPLVRHRRSGHEQRVVTSSHHPPAGYEVERSLGLVHWSGFSGTARIVTDPELGYATVPLGSEPDAEEMERTLGYAEQIPLPMLDPLMLCRHAATGAPVLVCGDDDPLVPLVDWPQISILGWIERWPINPSWTPGGVETTAWLRGLVRTVDRGARRHRIAIGGVPSGNGVWELGALLDRDPGGGIPAWTDAGRLSTGHYEAGRSPRSLRRSARWVLEPVGWRGSGPRRPRARAVVRRGLQVARHAVASPAPVRSAAAAEAWLLPEAGPQRVPVFAAIHPVTSDQLVTRDPSEARELGYEALRMLGYALAVGPVTGTLSPPQVGVAWARRFGKTLTRSEDPLADGR
jgi:glycosyltransferase involved in cell wall biosynthesis